MLLLEFMTAIKKTLNIGLIALTVLFVSSISASTVYADAYYDSGYDSTFYPSYDSSYYPSYDSSYYPSYDSSYYPSYDSSYYPSYDSSYNPSYDSSYYGSYDSSYYGSYDSSYYPSYDSSYYGSYDSSYYPSYDSSHYSSYDSSYYPSYDTSSYDYGSYSDYDWGSYAGFAAYYAPTAYAAPVGSAGYGSVIRPSYTTYPVGTTKNVVVTAPSYKTAPVGSTKTSSTVKDIAVVKPVSNTNYNVNYAYTDNSINDSFNTVDSYNVNTSGSYNTYTANVGTIAPVGTVYTPPQYQYQYTGTAVLPTSYYVPPTYAPYRYVSLSQIPYTGYDFGVVGNTLYWLAIFAVAVSAAYLAVYYIPAFAGMKSRMPKKVMEAPQIFVRSAASSASTTARNAGTTFQDSMTFAASENGTPRIVIARG